MEFFIRHLLFINWYLLHSLPVQADMLSACMEDEDILSDKQRGAHPSTFPSKARLPVAFPKGREPDTHSPLPWRLLCRLLRIKNPDIQLRRITYPPELLLAPNRRYPPSLGEGSGVGVSYAPNGALICQPRATPGELDVAGIRPRRGQKNKISHKRLWEGEAAFHSFAPAGRH